MSTTVTYKGNVITTVDNNTRTLLTQDRWVEGDITLTDSSRGFDSETDPIFSASPAASITQSNITSWNNKSTFSGNYNDLTNKPTIPAAQVNADWEASSGMAQILNKPNLSLVARTGSYNDLTNKPTIPTSISDLTNDSDYISTETDPVFLNSPAGSITANDILAWNNKSDFSGSYNDLTNKPNLSTYMVKGVDYVTAGKASGSTVGTKATAEGWNNEASGIYSHAEGLASTASGPYAHAEGENTYASLQAAHAEGYYTQSNGIASHAEGQSSKATSAAAHAEGYLTLASEMAAHAEGVGSTASGTYGSHAEGHDSLASGDAAHAEGWRTRANGQASHAEGNATTASNYAHAEGEMTNAYSYGHAEGSHTAARGQYSHSEGYYTIARYKSQHVFGEYNAVDYIASAYEDNRGNYIEIVGNGASTSSRSNARTLDWSGNEVLAGKLTVGIGPTNNMDVATKQYVDSHSSSYTLPTASTATLGGVKVDGNTITILNGVISAHPAGPAILATTATLAQMDWINNSQTINVTGVTASNIVMVTYAPGYKIDYENADIECSAQGAGTLTFDCYVIPSSDIVINILIIDGTISSAEGGSF